MRFWLLILTLTLGTLATAQEIYKTIDAEGNIVYSDTPPTEDAVPTELPEIIFEPSLSPRVKLSPDDNNDEEANTAISVSISSPRNDDVILRSASSIHVSGDTSRPLAEEEFTQLLVNGQPQGSVSKRLFWSVGDLIRGEYSLQIQIIQNGRTIASSQTVKVFVQRNIAR